jgi:hypothetical protein
MAYSKAKLKHSGDKAFVTVNNLYILNFTDLSSLQGNVCMGGVGGKLQYIQIVHKVIK